MLTPAPEQVLLAIGRAHIASPVGFIRDQIDAAPLANHDCPIARQGAQVVAGGRPAGRVTSARSSERVGATIGLAWVGPELAEEGAEIAIRVGAEDARATVTLRPFYDPDGERLRS